MVKVSERASAIYHWLFMHANMSINCNIIDNITYKKMRHSNLNVHYCAPADRDEGFIYTIKAYQKSSL